MRDSPDRESLVVPRLVRVVGDCGVALGSARGPGPGLRSLFSLSLLLTLTNLTTQPRYGIPGEILSVLRQRLSQPRHAPPGHRLPWPRRSLARAPDAPSVCAPGAPRRRGPRDREGRQGARGLLDRMLEASMAKAIKLEYSG